MDDSEKNGGASADSAIKDPLFIQLILSFQAAAWQQMGKIKSITTGKIERNIEMAKHSIDMLGMLEEKTKGNLSEDEAKYIRHILYELRMNYLDEAKKGQEGKAEMAEEPPAKEEEKPSTEDNELKD